MPDKFSSEVRSKIMSSIRSKNTVPELTIRKILWKRGARYRIHDKTVFGTPDISNKARKIAVFLDGCFWHGCERCFTMPKTNPEFWKKKMSANQNRRKIVNGKLKASGWTVMQFWEHDIRKNPIRVVDRIWKNWN